MFFVAYQRMYAKPGNMTPGTDGKTEDEMSIDRINKLSSMQVSAHSYTSSFQTQPVLHRAIGH